MIHITKFETQAAYEAAESGLILPNVSLTVDNNTVHYKPLVKHDFVEIAGIKWATMNIGANSVTDYGLYFQWGDPQGYTADQVGSDGGKKAFKWADYKHCDGTNSVMTKYNNTDGKMVLDASDDAVTAAWGGNWRMPTTDEFQALGNAVTISLTNDYQGSGIKGLVCTAKDGSGAQLFFPAAGYASDGSVRNVGNYGDYWSSSLSSDDVSLACRLHVDSSNVDWGIDGIRYRGYPVRGVFDENS